MRKKGFIFCLRFKRHFFRHTDLWRFKISKKNFLKIWILDIIEKCIGCFLVYPFLGFFLLKVQKRCVYVIMLKITLVLVKNVFFGLKKGISGLERWIAPKHTATVVRQLFAGKSIPDIPLGGGITFSCRRTFWQRI